MAKNRLLVALSAVPLLLLTLVVAGCPSGGTGSGGGVQLLNVSYDPTRELWKELNAAFLAEQAKAGGPKVTIKQSHGASGSQARAIVDGIKADVATLSLWPDTNQLAKQGLIKEGWVDDLPNNSLPYTSTVVFVVRKGNPKNIKDWPDLVQDGVEIITPNPKTSGNGRLSFLAAWGSKTLSGASEEEATAFVREIYKRVPVLDTGARGSTTTFAQKGLGDVHLAMESEAYLEVKESKGTLEIVNPSISILHEPHVTVVDKVVDEKGTRKIAEDYLKFVYTPAGQEIVAKNYYRPTDPAVLKAHADQFPAIRMFPVTDVAKDWDEAQKKFFADDGVFDQIYAR